MQSANPASDKAARWRTLPFLFLGFRENDIPMPIELFNIEGSASLDPDVAGKSPVPVGG